MMMTFLTESVASFIGRTPAELVWAWPGFRQPRTPHSLLGG